MQHLKSLECAITYIEHNLGNISVEDVARETGYSYYHLTRMFTAILGESIGSYIQKRRLVDSAQKLLYTNKRVIDIAIENGFESSEAFSRAFKLSYKVSPIIYRRNRLETIVGIKKQFSSDSFNRLDSRINLNPEIVETKEIKIVGIRGSTTLNDNVIPQLWERFWRIRDTIPNTIPTSRAIGVCESDSPVFSLDGNTTFSEVVGLEVIAFDNVPESLDIKTIRPGRFAVFTHIGSLRNLQNTYEYIWCDWAAKYQDQVANREDFEVYDIRYLGYDHPNTQFDIYIPLK